MWEWLLIKVSLSIQQRSHSNHVLSICIGCAQAFMSKGKLQHHLRVRVLQQRMH